MNKSTVVRITSVIFAVLMLISLALNAFAEGGNGDGTGGGKDQPLTLVSSSIPNGSENVSTTPEIVLTFSKNVVNFTVRDNNAKCFSMTDSKGNSVPVDVIMGDDQVDPSIKRIITVKPKSPLTPGETYLLKIGGGITSKSGVSIGRDTYIGFTVAEDTPASSSQPVTEASTTVVSTEAAVITTETRVLTTVTDEDGSNQTESELSESEYETKPVITENETTDTAGESEIQSTETVIEEETRQGNNRMPIVIGAFALIAVSAVVAAIVIINKKKK